MVYHFGRSKVFCVFCAQKVWERILPKIRDILLYYYATHPKMSVGVACNFPVPIDFEFEQLKNYLDL